MKIFLLILFVFLAGCATVKIVPQTQTGAQVDVDSLAITRQQDKVRVTVRVADVSVRPAPLEKNFCSFWIEITNQRTVLLPLSFSDFILIDADGQQYAAQAADELVALLKPEIPYLIPYPYVGYYYLADQARGRSADQFRSEASYATSRRPEQIELEALPEADVLPQSKVTGKVYFPAELRTMRSFIIRYQSGALMSQKASPLNFSFSVE